MPGVLPRPPARVGRLPAALGRRADRGRGRYRPLRDAARLAPVITAIGLSIFLQQQLVFAFYPVKGAATLGVKAPVAFPELPGPPVTVLGVVLRQADLLMVVLAVVSMAGLAHFVRRTRTGRAMQATAQDPRAARLMGIDTDRMVACAFGIGAALAALAALAYGLHIDAIAQFGGGAWKDVWAFAILIIVLLVRPQGLFGERVADRA
ncbi:hypothetical protein ETD85_36125 [Nonomuraea zeae]|uniref:Branched-chain amino acid ABC transporter permease n=1 Tax=Nonomuraea zeae TaxID=1642303 RepID=A0A5S4G746_9ACTN|nr:hypothetical protein ETD85_36125 [Nonomuraea zeae]